MSDKFHPEMDGKEIMTREEFISAFSQGQGSTELLMGSYKMIPIEKKGNTPGGVPNKKLK